MTAPDHTIEPLKNFVHERGHPHRGKGIAATTPYAASNAIRQGCNKSQKLN
jgi:hypothetical protein